MNEVAVQFILIGIVGVVCLIYLVGRIRVFKVLDQLKDPYQNDVKKNYQTITKLI